MGWVKFTYVIVKSRVINPNEDGFLDIPRQMVPLPLYYFEVIVVNGVVGFVVMVMNG